MLIIDPETGKVMIVLEAGHLIDRTVYPEAGVLNGIAYDRTDKKVYLTGKNWPFIKVCLPEVGDWLFIGYFRIVAKFIGIWKFASDYGV